jgi:hypothetical protein
MVGKAETLTVIPALAGIQYTPAIPTETIRVKLREARCLGRADAVSTGSPLAGMTVGVCGRAKGSAFALPLLELHCRAIYFTPQIFLYSSW